MSDDRRRLFERLYREYGPSLLAYALRRTDRETAQDAVAETFLVVWRRLDDLPAEPLPWLYGTARRVLANQHRAVRRRERLHTRLAAVEPGGAGQVDGRVLAALGALRASDRELLMLVAWEGLTPTQAATVLGYSANACRIRLHRARRKLERALTDQSRLRPVTAKPREAE
jgi:RNA polymerase sigma-70 factor (ECF subfamily)